MKDLTQAIKVLKDGGVAVFPTDTVYGVGAALSHVEAVKRLFTLKNRPLNRPLIALISSIEQASLLSPDLPETFFNLSQAFWPGALTLIVPKAPHIPDFVTGGLPSIGLRIPGCAIARALIEGVGEPLVTTSANISGEASPTSLESMGLSVDAVVDGGVTRHQVASTVVDLTTPNPTIVRQGAISETLIFEIV